MSVSSAITGEKVILGLSNLALSHGLGIGILGAHLRTGPKSEVSDHEPTGRPKDPGHGVLPLRDHTSSEYAG